MRYHEDDPRRLIARLAVAVMIADGRITPDERDALERLDRLGLGPLVALAQEEIERAVREPVDMQATCAGLGDVGPQGAARILAVLAEIAASDRSVLPREVATLNAIARLMGLTAPEMDEILRVTMSARGAGFATAGVEVEATP